MTNPKTVDRSAKLNRKLRASETERVKATRERDEARKVAVKLAQQLNAANAEIKKLKKEAGE